MDEPEKQFLKWDRTEIDTHIIDVIGPLYELAERELFKWKHVDIKLPETRFEDIDITELNTAITHMNEGTECAKLALDSEGNRKKLNEIQLDELRQTGRFRVASEQFPGKFHTWRVSKFLLRGRANVWKILKNDILLAARLMIVTARNRLISHRLSVRSSLRHIRRGLYLLLDLLFGMPHNNCGNVEQKIHEEKLSFMTCELLIPRDEAPNMEHFWNFLEHVSCLPDNSKFSDIQHIFPRLNEEQWPLGAYRFVSPTQTGVDLWLANKRVRNECQDLIGDCIERLNKDDWFLRFKEEAIEAMFEDKTPEPEMQQKILEAGLNEKYNRLYELLKKECDEKNVPSSICSMLLSNFKFRRACERAQSEYRELARRHRMDHISQVQRLHPYLSMVTHWMNDRLKEAEVAFILKNQLTPYHLVLKECIKDKLPFYEYFIRRMLMFHQERKPLLERQLMKNTSFPDITFEDQIRMRLSSQWKVSEYKNILGKKEYSVEKYKTVKWTSTRYPLWRWLRFFQTVFVWMLIVMQYLLIVMPFKTRFSYQAVFCRGPLHTKHELNLNTGKIRPLESHKVPTLHSRLTRLWRHVWRARNQFETSTASGVLDKAVARHFNRLWTIVLKGGIGTLLIITFFPATCMLLSSLSLLLALLAPLWLPLAALIWSLLKIFFFDVDLVLHGKHDRVLRRVCCFLQAIVWHVLLCGLAQLLLQTFAMLLLLPLLSLLVLLFGMIRVSILFCWDSLLLVTIFRKHAHIPATDDFITKRVSGPGVGHSQHILLQPKHAVIIFMAYLEFKELEAWRTHWTRIIGLPLRNYERFVIEVLGRLGVTVHNGHPRLQQLAKDKQIDTTNMLTLYNKRQKRLVFDSDHNNTFKMTSSGVKETVELCCKLAEVFYGSRIKPYLDAAGSSDDNHELKWWSTLNLGPGQCKDLVLTGLTSLFGDQVVSPIEDSLDIYVLEITDLTTQSYLAMFVDDQYLDDPSEPALVRTGSSASVKGQLDRPCLEYCINKHRRLQLPVLRLDDFFFRLHIDLPQPLASYPTSCKSHKKKVTKSVAKWFRPKPNIDVDFHYSGLALEPIHMELYHPLIICTLLHDRDRDNGMLNIEHRQLSAAISKCRESATMTLAELNSIEQSCTLDLGVGMSQSQLESGSLDAAESQDSALLGDCAVTNAMTNLSEMAADATLVPGGSGDYVSMLQMT